MIATTWTDQSPPPAPLIDDHGIIGDMRTAALLDRWGRINWLCWPRFDSSPVFRRLLDSPEGGYWQIAPNMAFSSDRRYLPDTNILETHVTCRDGTVVCSDFMVVPADDSQGPQLVRVVQGQSGAVPTKMRLRANPGFTAGSSRLHVLDGTLLIGDCRQPLATVTASEPIHVADHEAGLDVTLEPGHTLSVVMSCRPIKTAPAEYSLSSRDTTARWWRRWLADCALPSVQRNAVGRSALAMKLLQHEPTSGLVAAPTTSLPERVGGTRNWDYRYTWLRDSSMMLLALQRLGQHDEAMAYWDWLAKTATRHGDDLSIAYTVDGDNVPRERTVPDLPGYRASQPVRVGNAAAHQRQHDTYGHLIAAAAHCYHHMDMDVAAPGNVLRRSADLASRRWNRPDESVWEVRGGRRQHTYSRLMCWLTLDRAIDLSHHNALEGDVAAWTTQRDAIRRQILEQGWNPEVGAFTATVGGSDLDASTLVAPLIEFLPAHDHRCRMTRETIFRHLGDNGLIRRYRGNDGIEDTEGAFLLCTLWLADSYTADNDFERGEELLERVIGSSNDLGLLAEEVDPGSNELLGNFPQGLTHLGVIQSASRLDQIQPSLRRSP